MNRAHVERHLDLFEDDSCRIVMPLDQKPDVVRLIATMLIEIVTTMSMAMEGNHDKDHT